METNIGKQAINTYQGMLTRYDLFRYIILLNRSNKLLGMVDAYSLLTMLEDRSFRDCATQFDLKRHFQLNRTAKSRGLLGLHK